MTAAETDAARADAASTESLGIVCIAVGSATSQSKRHIVNPMPPSMPTTPRCFRFIPEGSLAMPSLSASQVNPKMPSGLPMTRPAAMPTAGVMEAAEAAAAAAAALAAAAAAAAVSRAAVRS